MTAASLKKAWETAMKSLNEQYEELDPVFMDNVRKAVEIAYKPLLADKKKKDRGVTAFNMYVSDFNTKHKDDPPVLVDGKSVTLFKLASDSWNKASEKTKAEFTKKAADHNTEKGIVAAVDRPKKAVNGYNLFVQEYKEKHTGSSSSGRVLFKEAAEEWNKKTPAEQDAYKQRAHQQNETNGVAKPTAVVVAPAPTVAAPVPAPVVEPTPAPAAQPEPVVEAAPKTKAPPKTKTTATKTAATTKTATRKVVKVVA